MNQIINLKSNKILKKHLLRICFPRFFLGGFEEKSWTNFRVARLFPRLHLRQTKDHQHQVLEDWRGWELAGKKSDESIQAHIEVKNRSLSETES